MEQHLRHLISEEIEQAFNLQGTATGKGQSDIKIICKLYNPLGSACWYLYEHFEADRYLSFTNKGDALFANLEMISLNELSNLKLPFGLRIVRDEHFPIAQIKLKDVYDEIKYWL
ncbi:MAG: DUF2958 domain-containing protein [Bacteroidota bacterium]